MDERLTQQLIQQYMQGDSKERAISHLKTLDVFDKINAELEAEQKKVVVLREALEELTKTLLPAKKALEDGKIIEQMQSDHTEFERELRADIRRLRDMLILYENEDN
jgi:hypothetical protein